MIKNSVMQKYQIKERKQDVESLIHSLHVEDYLSVGILDVGTERELLDTLDWYENNFNYKINVITDSKKYNTLDLGTKYPSITFIVFDVSFDTSNAINVFANNCHSTYFLLARTDMELSRFIYDNLKNLLESKEKVACICPVIKNKSLEIMPTVRSPHLIKGKEVDPMSFMPSSKTCTTLFPFYGIGFYDRALFQRLRGFDEQIEGLYWQSMDFGTRCWLYGNVIYTTPDFEVVFPTKQFLMEDRSEKVGIKRFYTKNLSVHKAQGKTTTKRTLFFDRKVLLKEVKPHLMLFKTDYETLCSLWAVPQD